MKIIDKNGNEILYPDFSRGYYIEDRVFVTHHPAQEYIPEQWHYEVIAEYPNGGKDIIKVIDVPGQEAKEAWDEYEDVLRWYDYTEEEIRARENIHLINDMMNALEILGVEK